MKRIIKKVAVLGSGVMGSRIACHFAGAGLQVLLLDIPAKQEDDKKVDRNKIVNDALAAAVKSNPSPIYSKDVLKRISTGNFEDNMKALQLVTGPSKWLWNVWISNKKYLNRLNNSENPEH